MRRLRRARHFRALLALANLVAATTALAGVSFLFILREEKAKPPPPPRVFVPEGRPEGAIPLRLDPRPADTVPGFAGTTPYEDLMVLMDTPRDFARSFRVVIACLDEAPAERSCIVEAVGTGQVVLVPGEQIGSWLLLGIEKEPGEPRSVRLRFRDTKRGEDVTTVLDP